MGRGFDAPFPYLSEVSIIDLRNLWDYVGRHGADDIHPLPLADCPVDSQRRYDRYDHITHMTHMIIHSLSPHICGETLLQNFRKK